MFKSLCVLLTGLLGFSPQAEAFVRPLSGAELDKIASHDRLKDKYLVLDLRSADDYHQGHLKHSYHVPREFFESRIEELRDWQKSPLVLVSYSTNIAALMAQRASDCGFQKVFYAPGTNSYSYKSLSTVPNLRAADVKRILLQEGKPLIFDARNRKDYQKGHLPGAIAVWGLTIEEMKALVPPGEEVLLSCYAGTRSHELATELQRQGIAVLNALDGTAEATYPLEK